jgi:hypothetical protein
MPEDKAQQALLELQEMGIDVDGVVEMARIAKAKAENRPYLIPITHEKYGQTWELHGPKHRAFLVTLDRLDAIVALHADQLLPLWEKHSKTRVRTKLRKNDK